MIYKFKKSFVDVETTYELSKSDLIVRKPGSVDSITLDEIREINLYYNSSRSKHNEYFCRIKLSGERSLEFSNKYYSGLAKFYDQSQEYNHFITELHRNLIAFENRITFSGGLKNPGFMIKFVLTLLLIGIFSVVIFIFTGSFGLILPLFFLWRALIYFQRNKPVGYHPDRIPDRLLPGYD